MKSSFIVFSWSALIAPGEVAACGGWRWFVAAFAAGGWPGVYRLGGFCGSKFALWPSLMRRIRSFEGSGRPPASRRIPRVYSMPSLVIPWRRRVPEECVGRFLEGTRHVVGFRAFDGIEH